MGEPETASAPAQTVTCGNGREKNVSPLATVRYAIVSPVRDEEAYIGRLAQSVVSQTLLPVKWIIVDDGSTDRTVQVLEPFLAAHDWIELIQLPDRGFRAPGGDDVFHIGLQRLNLNQLSFLARVDGDVSFSADFFARVFSCFLENPSLGIASGEMVYLQNGKRKVVPGPRFQTHGPCKVYRVRCFREIGGLDREIGWDILDNVRAIQRGWKTSRLSGIEFVHYRPVGQRRSKYGLYVNLGLAAYLCGYHPLFFWAKFLRYLLADPPILGSLVMAATYLKAWGQKRPRLVDRSTRKFVRNEQLKRLVGLPSIWR